MGAKFPNLETKHIDFIEKQHLFFTGTAGAEGFVNVSPKGLDSFRIIDESTVVWLNLTGSGNETAAHVLENERMTIMFCSFAEQTLILRLYGNATVIHRQDEKWDAYFAMFPKILGTRQFFELKISMVQTSCGFGVPLYDYKGDRETYGKWATNRGQEKLEEYWLEANTQSLDGKETNIQQNFE